MRGHSLSPNLSENSPPRSPSNIICITLVPRSISGLFSSSQRAENTLRTSSGWGLITTGTPGLIMPAFSPAISGRVLPSVFIWSNPIDAMTDTMGVITLVESRLPPRPTSITA